jgi:hypothetical protein
VGKIKRLQDCGAATCAGRFYPHEILKTGGTLWTRRLFFHKQRGIRHDEKENFVQE